jgi:hypothetical protein
MVYFSACVAKFSQEAPHRADKPTMDISAIALQGLSQSEGQVARAGGKLASIGINSGDNAPVDTADLSDAAVSLLSGKDAFATNIKLLKVADEMKGAALNLLA